MKFLSLAYGCTNNVAILDKFDGVSIFSFKKHAFANRVVTLMLLYRKQSMQKQEFFQMMQIQQQHLPQILQLETSIMIFQKCWKINFQIFTDHVQWVNKPRQISRSLTDHVFIKKSLMEEFFTIATVENICFSDHDAVRIIIEKNAIDFRAIP